MAIRVGFIGAGGIANAHLNILRAMPQVQVAAVCDMDPERAERAASPTKARTYISYKKMIEDGELDAVYVCVPPFAHADAELMAAQAGLHLFVEKPIGLNADRAQNVAREIEKARIISSVGYHWRYYSGVDEVRKRLKDRPLGFFLGYWLGGMPGVAWWRVKEQSGGQVVEQSTHIFDLARFLAGDVARVSATPLRGLLAPKVDNYNVEDASGVTMVLQSGAIGAIWSSDILKSHALVGLHLYCEDLVAEVTSELVRLREIGKVTELRHTNNPYQAENEAFIEAIRTGDASAIRSPYADAVRTLALTLAANQAMETGSVVAV